MLTQDEWRLAQMAAAKRRKRITRPRWIGEAIRKQAKRENVKM
jgi:hypothetical protein